MSAPHPITTLSVEQLPGWNLAMEVAGDIVSKLLIVGRDPILLQFDTLRAIGEGLLFNAEAEQDETTEEVGYALADTDAADIAFHDSIDHLLVDEDIAFYQPVEVLKMPGDIRQWVVRFKSAEECGWTWIPYALQADAQAFCDRANEAAEADQQGLAEAVAEKCAARVEVPAAPPPPPSAAAPVATAPTSPVWSPERIAVLDAAYAHGTPPNRPQILEAVNKLPGPPCASAASMHMKAVALGFNKRSPAPTAATAAIVPRAEPAIPEEDKAEARRMVLEEDKGAKDLVEEFGWDLGAAQRFAADTRDAARGAA